MGRVSEFNQRNLLAKNSGINLRKSARSAGNKCRDSRVNQRDLREKTFPDLREKNADPQSDLIVNHR